jgi:GNAT superfamily N-acetyltransferase
MTPAGDELVIRHAGPADEPALLRLITLCLGPGSVPRTADFWRWKHTDNPFGPSPMLVAEAEGRIVGLRTFLRWRWRSAGRDVPAVRAVDTVTHPEWRGRGVFSRLTRRLLDEVAAQGTAFVFNTPNRTSGAGYRKLGWATVGRAPLLVRPLAPLAALLRLARRGDAATPRADGPVDAEGAPDLSRFPGAGALLDTPIVDDLLEARDQGPSDRRYTTSLDRPYLRWRYAAPPGLRYGTLWRENRSGSAAVIFRGRRRGRLREVLVTEILAPPARAGRRHLVELLRELAADAPADYLVAAASRGTPERKALLRCGFLPVPGAGPTIVTRPLTSDTALPDPGDSGSWRWSAGALELF